MDAVLNVQAEGKIGTELMPSSKYSQPRERSAFRYAL